MNRSGRAWREEEVARAITLKREGLTYREIAAYLDRSRGGVGKLLAANGFRRPNGRPATNGFFCGPAIGRCGAEERLKQNAITGSARLLAAIEQAGVHP